MEDKVCYDVLVSSKGDLLVGRDGGLDILSPSSGEILKSLLFDDRECVSIEVHNDTVIFTVNTKKIPGKSMFIIMDNDYKEIKRWSTQYCAVDFTIVDNKLFVTLGSWQRSTDIKVYSLEDEEMTSISWSGEALGIAGIEPNFIVYCDQSQHRVYKRTVTPSNTDIEWVADVKAPYNLHIAVNGLIWVRSDRNDCLTILNRDGR